MWLIRPLFWSQPPCPSLLTLLIPPSPCPSHMSLIVSNHISGLYPAFSFVFPSPWILILLCEGVTPSHPLKFSSDTLSSTRSFLTILSEDDHFILLLVNLPVNILHSTCHTLKRSLLFVGLLVLFCFTSIAVLNIKLRGASRWRGG